MRYCTLCHSKTCPIPHLATVRYTGNNGEMRWLVRDKIDHLKEVQRVREQRNV